MKGHVVMNSTTALNEKVVPLGAVLARSLTDDEIDRVAGAGTPICCITIGDKTTCHKDQIGDDDDTID